jgi:hypothetical protein
MDQKLPPFLRLVGSSVVYNGDGEFYFYIPEKFFDLRASFYVGESINSIGILNYAISDKNNKLGELREFNYPTRFLTTPYKVNKVKGIKLIKESEPMDYRILCYRKNDPIIVNINVPEELSTMEDFIRLFVISGVIPNTIPYDKIQEYFINNIAYNGESYNVSLQLFGIVISELCRDPDNINIPFRLSKTNDMKAYKAIGVKTVAKLISAYSSITSENFNESVVFASLNTNKVKIPLERVLTGEDI